MNLFNKITKVQAKSACRKADSKSQMARLLGIFHINGTVIKNMGNLIKKYELDSTHFDNGKQRRYKYKRIIRKCPVCGDDFQTQDGGKAEKQTCSYSCSNTYFRSGINNGMCKNGNGKKANSSYRFICFKHHEKKCIICGEDKIVAVHHYDGNNKNNNPKNLVPLCPTHHQYWHSKHKNLIEEKVKDFVASIV